jgi:hypothetical protein
MKIRTLKIALLPLLTAGMVATVAPAVAASATAAPTTAASAKAAPTATTPTTAVPATAAPATSAPAAAPAVSAQSITVLPGVGPITPAGMASGTYLILAPRLEGKATLLGADQQKGILDAMARDSRGAILRRYPQARFATDPATPGAIQVQPVLVMPGWLLPWASMSARLEFARGASRLVLAENFSVGTVFSKQSEAANYVFDAVMKKAQ